MSTSKEYKDYILEQLSILDNITCRPMMGEYLLYYNNVLIGGIYDNRFLVKINNDNISFKMNEEIPYKGAKPMSLVSDIDEPLKLKEIVLATYQGQIDIIAKKRKKQ